MHDTLLVADVANFLPDARRLAGGDEELLYRVVLDVRDDRIQGDERGVVIACLIAHCIFRMLSEHYDSQHKARLCAVSTSNT